MKLRYKTTIVVAGFVVLLSLAASLFIAFQPDPRYDREKVHPRLLSLQQPYKTVRTYYFMDGGSIGIEIVDREGRKEQFAVLALMGEPNPYTRVLVGGLHHRAPGAVELHDASGNQVRMALFLVRVFEEFIRNRLRVNPFGHEMVAPVT